MHKAFSKSLGIEIVVACAGTSMCSSSPRQTSSASNRATPEGAHDEAKSNNMMPTELRDPDIRTAVVDELFRASHILGSSLVVGCKDGIVDLTGSVDNLLAKRRAVAVAESVRGVR